MLCDGGSFVDSFPRIIRNQYCVGGINPGVPSRNSSILCHKNEYRRLGGGYSKVGTAVENDSGRGGHGSRRSVLGGRNRHNQRACSRKSSATTVIQSRRSRTVVADPPGAARG